MARRRKLSTTVSPEGYSFLRGLVRAGKASNLAQAIDLVLEEFRRIENRRRLERATAEYYEKASQEAIDEENHLAAAFSATASEIEIDG
ncbi:MAG: hypothetical protein LAN36_13020 [Acidobacteriia bacterium]|nr:hypothetical protein [Terriglobia bacterium]